MDRRAGVDISRWVDIILCMWSCWVGCHEAEIPPSRVLPFLQWVCHGPRLVGSNCALVYHILYFRPPCYSRALPTFHPHISLSLPYSIFLFSLYNLCWPSRYGLPPLPCAVCPRRHRFAIPSACPYPPRKYLSPHIKRSTRLIFRRNR